MTVRRSPFQFLIVSLIVCQGAFAAGPRPVRPVRSDASACLKSSETAQSLENTGKLLEASASFAECAQAQCPGVVVADCSSALERLKARIPSLSLRVQDTAQQDILGAKVLLDGSFVSGALKGALIPLNPGKHSLKITAEGFAVDTRDVLVTTGEQARVIAVVLKRTGEEGSSSTGGPGAGPWIVMGIGGAALGVGAVLYATAPALPAGCSGGSVFGGAGSCVKAADGVAAQKHDNAVTFGLQWMAGGALVAGGGLVWYLVAPKGDATSTSWRISPAIPSTDGFGGLRATGHF